MNLFYLALLAAASTFLVASAIVGSEYAAKALEFSGSVGATFVYGIFLANAANTIVDWNHTQGAAWAAAFAAGSGWRVAQLGWEFTPRRWRRRLTLRRRRP